MKNRTNRTMTTNTEAVRRVRELDELMDRVVPSCKVAKGVVKTLKGEKDPCLYAACGRRNVYYDPARNIITLDAPTVGGVAIDGDFYRKGHAKRGELVRRVRWHYQDERRELAAPLASAACRLSFRGVDLGLAPTELGLTLAPGCGELAEEYAAYGRVDLLTASADLASGVVTLQAIAGPRATSGAEGVKVLCSVDIVPDERRAATYVSDVMVAAAFRAAGVRAGIRRDVHMHDIADIVALPGMELGDEVKWQVSLDRRIGFHREATLTH